MSLNPLRSARIFLVVPAACLLILGVGCDELKARRQIQEGNKLYVEGRYSKAVDKFEAALAIAPDLEVGQYNAGLAYLKLFEPGNPAKENTAYAEKAAAHFLAYLDKHPDDSTIVRVLTNTWIDSGQFEAALDYWKNELEKDPDSREVLLMLATINRQAGRHEKALSWLERRIALESEDAAKAQGYMEIGLVQLSRLRKSDLVDYERIVVADVGIAALQKAEALAPNNSKIQSVLGSLYQFRAVAHGASWAQVIDTAAQRNHQVRWQNLNKKAKEAADKAQAAGGSAAEKKSAN